ncbi:MAG: Ig-like domain-containing protein, partial [Comamonas sp.]|nr:Ig-like domain-containing protein [Comamonas sp.]
AKAISVDGPPLITSSDTATAIDENSGAGQTVYTVTATDSGPISYSLKAGGDAAAFTIDAQGHVKLLANPDYETKSSYSFTVVATDAQGHSSEQVVTLAVNNLPEVSSVAITGAKGAQNETLNAGDVVSITVTMDSATFVDTTGGVPRLALKIGDRIFYADYASGSGSTALVFQYTIQAGQTDADGISIPANALSLNGGSLKDAAGHAATLSHEAVADNGHYLVDTTPPTATLSEASSMNMLEGLGKTDGLDKNPQIAVVGANGSYVVVWAGEAVDSKPNEYHLVDGEDTRIFMQQFNADGSKAASGPIQLSDQFSETPQVSSMGVDGSYVVAWSGRYADGSGKSIYLRSFKADGTPSGDLVKLEANGMTGGDNLAPQLARLADGSFVVTWTGMDVNLDYSIFVQKFNADGSKSSTPAAQLELPGKTDGNDFAPQVSPLGDGSFVVTFYGADVRGNDSIAVQKFNADGTTFGHTMQVLHGSAIISPSEAMPQVSALGMDGSFVVTWYGTNSVGNKSIYVQKFGASGLAVSPQAELKPFDYPAGGDNKSPHVTALGSDGSFVVVWSGQNGGDPMFGTHTGIYVQKFQANGQADGSMTRLDAPNQQGNSRTDKDPQVTALGDGGYVVTWSGQDSRGDFNIFVQKFNSDGTSVGHSLQQLKPQGVDFGNGQTPQVKGLGSDGSFVVTWSGSDSGGDASIFVQQFGADGKPIVVDGATVRSSEAGTAYLVHSSVIVTDEASIKGAAADLWKSVAVNANADVIIAKAGLADGSYKLYTVDAAGNLSKPASGSVVIDHLPPAFTSGATAAAIDENSGAGQVIYTAQTSDVSTVTYRLSGVDAAKFSIDAASGEVRLIANPDYEAQSSYSFKVVATDALGHRSEQAVTLAINDLPEVSSVAITSAEGAQNDTLNAGDVVSITVTMDSATFVDTTGGVPRLALNIGGQTVYADYASGSGTAALVFHYTIQAEQTDANGISIPANALSLNGGSLKDAAGHTATLSHGALADDGHYLVDTTAPTLASASPADDTSNVAAGANIVLNFSETVKVGSGSIRIINDDDPSKSLYIDVTDSSQVGISGATVTINPGSDLLAGGKYHVEVDNGAFKDAAGNGYAGISDSTTLNFTVAAAAPQSHTLMVYSDGVYVDQDGNGVFSAGDTALLIKGAMGWEYTQAATGTIGFHGVSGNAVINGLQDGSGHAINLAADTWTVKFFSVLGPTLDLTGFGRDDSVVVDMATRTHGSVAMDLDLDPQHAHGVAEYSWQANESKHPTWAGSSMYKNTWGAEFTLNISNTKIFAEGFINYSDEPTWSYVLAQGMSDIDFLNKVTFILPTNTGPV